MSEFRYKAYISYAHADETWAAWLQRALEGYRVPVRLQSTRPDRPLPKRLAPVFRDREDLSSASDLSQSLKQALERSEAMILVCSPAAANSRWVDEEVRYFQSLGRADRILCMIVDGDPTDSTDGAACFPPALFDGVQDAEREPLAADPRPFADGKRLAKLKLAAGLLEVRLDQLRQRDLRRRRRWQLVGAVALVLALGLVASAWRSSLAERQERQKAEQMAGFIVDMVQDVGSDLDLESLSRMSTKVLEYWEGLDPERLSPQMQINVAVALYQLGQTTEQQGRHEEALANYLRSRDLLRRLHEERPELVDAHFELGQAEFWVGNYYNNRGDIERATGPLQEYERISRALYASDPENEAWLLELSYAVTGRLARKLLTGTPLTPGISSEVDEAVELADRALSMDPDSPLLLSNYATTLAWASDARWAVCDLAGSMELREERLTLAQRALEIDPSDNFSLQELAYAHTGLANGAMVLGQLDAAMQHLRDAIAVLEKQYVRDRGNYRIHQELLRREVMQAELLTWQGRLDEARQLLERIDRASPLPAEGAGLEPVELRQAVERLHAASLVARRSAREIEAIAHLNRARGFSRALGPNPDLRRIDHIRRVALEYDLWILNGQPDNVGERLRGLGRTSEPGTMQSCESALAGAMLAVMAGRPRGASEAVHWLDAQGYDSPLFNEFVNRHGFSDD